MPAKPTKYGTKKFSNTRQNGKCLFLNRFTYLHSLMPSANIDRVPSRREAGPAKAHKASNRATVAQEIQNGYF